MGIERIRGIFMRSLQIGTAYVGRVLLSLVFLFSAIVEMLNWPKTEQYFTAVFSRWMHVYQGNESVGLLMADILAWLPGILVTGICLRFLGALLMIIGWQVRLGAFCLLLFLGAETFLVYDFWHLPESEAATALVIFFKNIAVFGGLLLVLAFGKGRKESVEAQGK